MAVATKFYSTLDKNQESPRMFDAKTDAVAYDLYLEAVYAISEIILESDVLEDEKQADALAEKLVQERARFLGPLKKVPDAKAES